MQPPPPPAPAAQTYTYFIKTVCEEASDDASVVTATDGIVIGKDSSGGTSVLGGSRGFDDPNSQARGSSMTAQAVHGYEVGAGGRHVGGARVGQCARALEGRGRRRLLDWRRHAPPATASLHASLAGTRYQFQPCTCVPRLLTPARVRVHAEGGRARDWQRPGV